MSRESKRAKCSVLSLETFDTSSARESYISAQPYSHGVVSGLGVPAMMSTVSRELVEHLSVKYKESDLFKVYQTIDLGNLRLPENRELAERMPTTMALLDELYGASFRDFISKTTGCKPLSGTNQDCSANVYMKGGHLLCHDDVIGTRAVSYIIYLTDEQSWTLGDGGSLELFPLSGTAQPAFSPTKGILPTFNTMAFFAVQPGVSYHQVQEVFAENKPRLSISGWFHWEDPKPDHEEKATASRLHLQVGGGLTEQSDFEQIAGSSSSMESLTEEDKTLLSRYVNTEYLNEGNIKKIRDQFIEESSVELRDFLCDERSRELEPLLLETERSCPDPAVRPCLKTTEGWDEVGPPHLRHYLKAQVDGEGLPGKLEALRRDLFASTAFARLLNLYTTMLPYAHRGDSRWFRRGLDYTVAHADAMAPEHRLDATLCLLPQDTDEAAFDSGDFGGFDCFIAADDSTSGAAAAVFREDDDDGLLVSVSPRGNALSLVLRDPEVMRFIKYVAASAPSSRYDICVEYKIPAVDDEDRATEDNEEAKPKDDTNV